METIHPALLTVEQVAERLGISKYQVYRRMHRGDLKVAPVHTRRSQLLTTEKDLEEYIAAGGPQVLTPRPALPNDWVTTREVCRRTGYDPETVRSLCHSGQFAHTKGNGPRGQFRVWWPSVCVFLGSND